MSSAAILRQIFKDSRSLEDYLSGNPPGYEEIRHRLRIEERRNNRKLPDHYYKSIESVQLNNINDLGTLLVEGVHRLTEDLLEIENRRVRVKHEKLVQWQELTSFVSPSLCIAALIYRENRHSIYGGNKSKLLNLIEEWIKPNIERTSLLHPRYNHLEADLKERKGYHDLHFHLSGSTEIDRVFQFLLNNVMTASREFTQQFRKDRTIKEQLDQEGSNAGQFFLFERLNPARRIRSIICLMMSQELNGKHEDDTLGVLKSIPENEFFKRNSIVDTFLIPESVHPMRKVLRIAHNTKRSISAEMILEVLMYIMIFDRLARCKEKALAQLFHCYLLIWGSINRLMVQQIDHFGFEQFGKITDNKLRDLVEKNFEDRFHQLSGNGGNFVHFFEARFSPKESLSDNMKLIQKIADDYSNFRKNTLPQESDLDCRSKVQKIICEKDKRSKKLSDLKLVAHFIKKAEKRIQTEDFRIMNIRHSSLYTDIFKKANSLVQLKMKNLDISDLISGIDAASNELFVPPEVFAPVYCYLRKQGFKHFTYHVGEDFVHVLSGMRAIYEAVEFLQLNAGDRIGHATAAAIDINLWYRMVGSQLYIKRGEFLDDLVFAYHFINNHAKHTELLRITPSLGQLISRFGGEIHYKSYSVNEYINAWQLRQYYPQFLFDSLDRAYLSPYFEFDTWKKIQESLKNTAVMELATNYHRVSYREKYDELIPIDPLEIFDSSTLTTIQNILLEFLNKKEIVIETLPSSNVRISYYDTIHDHHIWRLLNISKEKNNGEDVATPPVVVGSDDPGIFSTNIFIEYALIYETLVYKFNMDRNQAVDHIKRLEQNSMNYRFD